MLLPLKHATTQHRFAFSRRCVQFDAARHKDLVSALVRSAVVAKITGAGLPRPARQRSHASDTGTQVYAAPEVLRKEQLQKCSNVYAFGVVMWELIMGTGVLVSTCTSPSLPSLKPLRFEDAVSLLKVFLLQLKAQLVFGSTKQLMKSMLHSAS
jgi:serine/threonine protein kinase